MKLTYSDDSASDYENCKGIICMFNDPKESFSANLISLWRIFIGGKKKHSTPQCVDRFEQICEAGDVIVPMERRIEEQYVLKCAPLSTRCFVLGVFFVSIRAVLISQVCIQKDKCVDTFRVCFIS